MGVFSDIYILAHSTLYSLRVYWNIMCLSIWRGNRSNLLCKKLLSGLIRLIVQSYSNIMICFTIYLLYIYIIAVCVHYLFTQQVPTPPPTLHWTGCAHFCLVFIIVINQSILLPCTTFCLFTLQPVHDTKLLFEPYVCTHKTTNFDVFLICVVFPFCIVETLHKGNEVFYALVFFQMQCLMVGLNQTCFSTNLLIVSIEVRWHKWPLPTFLRGRRKEMYQLCQHFNFINCIGNNQTLEVNVSAIYVADR